MATEPNAVYFAHAHDVFRGDLAQIGTAAVIDVRWPTYRAKSPDALTTALTPQHYLGLQA